MDISLQPYGREQRLKCGCGSVDFSFQLLVDDTETVYRVDVTCIGCRETFGLRTSQASDT